MITTTRTTKTTTTITGVLEAQAPEKTNEGSIGIRRVNRNSTFYGGKLKAWSREEIGGRGE